MSSMLRYAVVCSLPTLVHAVAAPALPKSWARQTNRPEPTECGTKRGLDIVFVVDESGSTCGEDQNDLPFWKARWGNWGCHTFLKKIRDYVEPDGLIEYRGERMAKYRAQRQLVKDLSTQFVMGNADHEARVGIVGFGDDGVGSFGPDRKCRGKMCTGARVLSPLSGDRSQFEKAVDGTESVGGTFVRHGITKAVEILQSQGRSNTAHIIVVILDGSPRDNAKELEEVGHYARSVATVTAIGYEAGADLEMLSKLANPPASQWVYGFHNLDDSRTMLERVPFRAYACEILPPTSFPTTSPTRAPTNFGATWGPTTTPISVSGDPFTNGKDGSRVQFFLPLHTDTKLLTCGDFTLYGSVMGSGIPGDHEQWFEAFRILLLGQEKVRVAVSRSPSSNNLTTIAVHIENAPVRNVAEVAYDGFAVDVSQHRSVRIGHGFAELVHFSAGQTELDIVSAVARKEESEELKLRHMHLDLGFTSINVSSCSAGVLAEIWGNVPMSNATTAMLQPPSQ